MKEFIRTGFGKVLLYLVCIFSVLVFCMSLFLAAEFRYSNYYTKSEGAVVKAGVEDIVHSIGRDIIMNVLNVRSDVGDASYLPEDEINLNYQVLDDKGKVIAESKDLEEEWEFTGRYGILSDNDGIVTDVFYSYEDIVYAEDEDPGIIYYTFRASLKEGLPADDNIAIYAKIAHICYSIRYWVFLIGAGAFVLMLISFIALMYSAGHKAGTDEIFPGLLHKVPYDVIAAGGIFIMMIGLALAYELYGVIELGIFRHIFFIAVGISFCMAIALGLCMSLAVRIKRKELLKKTVTWKLIGLSIRFLKWCWKGIKRLSRFNCYLFSKIPLIWKTVLVFGAISLFELIILAMDYYHYISFWFIERIILAAFIMYMAIMLRKLQAGAKALANGDLKHHINTEKMFWDFRKSGEDLNNIAVGMSYAVEDRLKSERMKTELITNVSHDLKTPLTSIVNYASLIETELKGIHDHLKTVEASEATAPSMNTEIRLMTDPAEYENRESSTDAERYEKISSYSSVLVRQSEKLKRLIEDLVEASKASTGNLDVQLSPCDPAIFISQAAGEYEERLEQAGLALITKLPEKEIFIMADGRRMWRIFDNLMSNICKYSLPGSRVYLSLEEDGTEDLAGSQNKKAGKEEYPNRRYAVLTFKNTSGAPLDISEEELMERFVRGDSSRTAEGNGLGLSIARSLAELQGGEMNIHIDGDLFKSILKFPIIGI